MKYLYGFVILNTFVISTLSSGFGKCPNIPSMSDFNVTKFSGQWFEVERSFYMLEMASSCTSLKFIIDNRRNYNIEVSTFNRWTKKTSNAYGTVIPMFKDSSIFRYKVNTKLPYPIARFLPGAGIYNIIYTDYENYAIVWYCSNILFTYNDRLFVFGRDRHISENVRIEVYNRVKSQKLNPDRLILSKNANCTSD